jgi:hypothetical protein
MRLDKRLHALNEERGALVDEIEALDPATLVARPRVGKWSILEVIEHLVLAERAVLQDLPELSRPSAWDRPCAWIGFTLTHMCGRFGGSSAC